MTTTAVPYGPEPTGEPELHRLMNGYRLHGLRIQSEIRLHAVREDVPEAESDLRFSLGPRREIPASAPEGHLLLANEAPQPPLWITRRPDGSTLLRFARRAECCCCRKLRECTLSLHPGLPEELAQLLLTSSVLSALLTLKGRAVLHASAVRLGDATFLFAGPSFSGKTTLAAALCAEGGRLLCDDSAAPVQDESGALLLHPADQGLRLRAPLQEPGALAYADSVTTLDERLCLLGLGAPTPSQLKHLVLAVPKPSQDGLAPQLSPLVGAHGSLRLAAAFRMINWRPPQLIERQFRALGDLSRHLRLWELQVDLSALHQRAGRLGLLDCLRSLD